MKKEILNDTDALMRGINKLANAVKVTLGPRGRNVVLGRLVGVPHVTKDGVTVAKEFHLNDENENLGARLVRQAASKTADVAGDGTTTATVLTQALMTAGLKQVAAGANPMDLKRGIDRATAIVVAELKKMSKEVKADGDEILSIATISANGDEEIGKHLAEAMKHVGRQGVVTVEEGKSHETTLEKVTGIQYDRGYLTHYFVTDAAKMRVVYEDCYVLVHDKKVSTIPELLPVLEAIAKSGKPALMVVDDMDGDALNTVVMNRMERGLPVVVIKAPGFGQRRAMDLEDIATLTGATVITEKRGLKLDQAGLHLLGKAKKVIVERDKTTIVEGGGDPAAIADRIEQVRSMIEETDGDFDKEMLQDRLGRLEGGVAVLRVGAHTDVELKEKRDRVDDALHATRAAVEEGILPGGGTAYLKARGAVLDLMASASPGEADVKTGMQLVLDALSAPILTIVENAGERNGYGIADRILGMGGMAGFNARILGYEPDMVKAGIIDPTKVVRVALENAASVAGTLLTTGCVINELEEDEPLAPHERGRRG